MSSSESDDVDSDSSKPFLIVTGSSAGGIDALCAFVTKLPRDLPAAVVIAQHLAPTHESHLAQILAQRTPLPVQTIDKAVELRAGTIYVVPQNHDIDIFDDSARICAEVRRGPKPSIDRLFTTAAHIYQDRAIAIVFSGLGSDGLEGARAVKRAGGTVLVQEPRSAGFPAMPLSIPPTLVDVAATPDAMGTIITGLIRSSEPPVDPNDKKLLRQLLTQLRERSGIDFSQYKLPTILRRLSRLMAASGANTTADYLAYLQRNPEGYQRLVSSFLIKVTEFFRDAPLYDTLRDQILPKLMAEANEHGRELRIWSAGTSTGEEAYSIAILCAELMRDDPDSVSVRIFATDIDEQAIAFARRGIYSKDALRNVPESLMQRYFTKVEDHYEVGKAIRNMTVFGQHDLGQRAPFPRIDLCLCRNVLIYFTKELQTRALQLFAFALRDGGYLALGKAESTTPLPQFFRMFNSGLKIYQREGERLMLPPTPLKDAGHQTVPNFLRGAAARELRGSRPELPPPPSRDAIAAYIGGSVVGVVVVDRNYDILAINSAARAMLQIHGVGIGNDLIHLLPATGNTLRTMIDAVITGDAPEPRVIQAKDPGIDRWLQIFCYSERLTANTLGETIGIIIVDVTRYETRIQEAEHAAARADELTARMRAVLAANDELTATNAELRTYNEQLLINAEEAASANEEIETLNEEMQATNEELETLNEELQATVEELNTTNDELEARSIELERANAAKQAEVERTNEQRRALVLALESLAPSSILVSSRGEVIAASTELIGVTEAIASAGRWWNEASIIRLTDGRAFRTTVRPLDGPATDLRPVTFEKA